MKVGTDLSTDRVGIEWRTTIEEDGDTTNTM